MVKNLQFGIKPTFKSQLYHLLAVTLDKSLKICMCINFLDLKTGQITVPS